MIEYAINVYYDATFPMSEAANFISPLGENHTREALLQRSDGKYQQCQLRTKTELIDAIRYYRPMTVLHLNQ